MRTAEEVFQRVTARGDEILARRRKTRRAIAIGAGTLCLALAVAAVWGGFFGTAKQGAAQASASQLAAEQSVAAESSTASERAEQETQPEGVEIETEAPEGSNEVGAPVRPNNYPEEEWEPRPLIESYDYDGAEACYAAPENGTVGFSMPLRAAMDEYGDDDTVLYRVFVDLFRDGAPVEPDSEEAVAVSEKLAAMHYTVCRETTYYYGTPTKTAITLHATYAQLAALRAPEGYGMMLFLYDGERLY